MQELASFVFGALGACCRLVRRGLFAAASFFRRVLFAAALSSLSSIFEVMTGRMSWTVKTFTESYEVANRQYRLVGG